MRLISLVFLFYGSLLQATVFQPTEPVEIRKGLYGAQFKNEKGETLYLRMESAAGPNINGWKIFQVRTKAMSPILKTLCEFPKETYEKNKSLFGFTAKEYDSFEQKLTQFGCPNKDKARILFSSGESSAMLMYDGSFIVYITKDPDFDGSKIHDIRNLKEYIDSYSSILIAVGSDFSDPKSFHSRGIFRNPYWVVMREYSGLSMLLHAFTGAVATKFFPTKTEMHVRPTGSMQAILIKTLQPGDGYISENGEKIDITTLKPEPFGPDLNNTHHIKIQALNRIYQDGK